MRNAEVVVEGARKEGICLVIAEGTLCGLVEVVIGEPEEVVSAKVYACAEEMQEEWVALVDNQDVGGLKNPDLRMRT